jgi:hypothetical protein
MEEMQAGSPIALVETEAPAVVAAAMVYSGEPVHQDKATTEVRVLMILEVAGVEPGLLVVILQEEQVVMVVMVSNQLSVSLTPFMEAVAEEDIKAVRVAWEVVEILM